MSDWIGDEARRVARYFRGQFEDAPALAASAKWRSDAAEARTRAEAAALYQTSAP